MCVCVCEYLGIMAKIIMLISTQLNNCNTNINVNTPSSNNTGDMLKHAHTFVILKE